MTDRPLHWAIPVVCDGFRSDDPVRWFIVRVGDDRPVQGCGWPSKAAAEDHARSSGLNVKD